MMGRRGSTKKGQEEGWTCKLCNQKFTDEKAELLECEYCSGHYCRGCLKLSQAEYKLLCKRSDLHWYCPPCEEKAMKNLKIEREIEDRCKAYFEKYESRLVKLEEMVAKKPDLEEVKTLVENSIVEGATGGECSNNYVNDKLEEYKDSMSRRNNVIIFKAEESTDNEPSKRKEIDQGVIEGLCRITGVSQEAVKNVTRLGKKKEDSDKPRPMRVIFDGEKSKSQFMANLKNLAEAEEKFKQLSIVHDMTKKERQEGWEKYNQVKEKIKMSRGNTSSC